MVAVSDSGTVDAFKHLIDLGGLLMQLVSGFGYSLTSA